MYDETLDSGIRANLIGPHIFHTDNERVFDYINRFCSWREYQHHVLADWYGTYLPLPFNENALDIAFGEERSRAMIEHLEELFGHGAQATLAQLQDYSDDDCQDVAEFLYDNIFRAYTRKQWGVDPAHVDTSIMGRVPLRLSRDNRYYLDGHQGVPAEGYTALFERILGDERITVCLETEAESIFGMEFADLSADAPLVEIQVKHCAFRGPIVFSGPIDELFLQRFGRLPYRTIDFQFHTIDQKFALPCGTVNHTVSDDFTRVTECKRITGQDTSQTTLVREFPQEYTDPSTQMPLYPVITDENRAQHQVYMKLVEPLSNFHAIGRLAEYRYYDMDEIVARALAQSDELCRRG
jgi:UDP-galactopyranose mutase